MKNGKKTFTILKVVGIALFICALVLVILAFTVGERGINLEFFIPGVLLIPISIFATLLGFMPNIMKGSAKMIKYIQENNKENLKEIAKTAAEINSEAVKVTAAAVKEGMKEGVCKYCGATIDSESIYCNKCGEKQ